MTLCDLEDLRADDQKCFNTNSGSRRILTNSSSNTTTNSSGSCTSTGETLT